MAEEGIPSEQPEAVVTADSEALIVVASVISAAPRSALQLAAGAGDTSATSAVLATEAEHALVAVKRGSFAAGSSPAHASS